ncbi:hypothetical protein PTTG_29806 [Puccinia triticina 1-1 BBBD Race 1]|uniref:Uncharacterized protein n=1 Tax=Puccinia triticina (isolate 1-1 / race 1 (BBBD)) TaxID=630390 RepID=A0A180G2F6_PUCT1|nr:hypothetical protein PTTG_29806 [Puccinia triticina 1-1 BBBD Race 1]
MAATAATNPELRSPAWSTAPLIRHHSLAKTSPINTGFQCSLVTIFLPGRTCLQSILSDSRLAATMKPV